MLPKLLNKNKIELILIGVAIELVTMSSVPSSIKLKTTRYAEFCDQKSTRKFMTET
jgi:hypothetical protein